MLFFWLELFGDLAAGNMQVIFLAILYNFRGSLGQSCRFRIIAVELIPLRGVGAASILGQFRCFAWYYPNYALVVARAQKLETN